MFLAQVEYELEVTANGLSAGAVAAIVIIAILIAILAYLYMAYCTWVIAKKLNMEYPWLAWIPIAQFYLMAKMAGYGGGWFLLLFVPYVGYVMWVIVWMKIARFLGKENVDILYGLLMIIPIANFIAIGILSFSKSARVQAPPGVPPGMPPGTPQGPVPGPPAGPPGSS